MLSNKFIIPAAIVVGGLIAGGIGYAVAYSVRAGSESSQSNVSTNQESTLGSRQNPHKVKLTKSETDPVDLLINVGDYVQFDSDDAKEHQIIQGKPTEDHGHDALSDATHGEEHGITNKPLDSGIIKADEGYLVQFKNVGKFEFHDNFNHDYAITVIVYDKDKKLKDTKIE